MQVYGQLLAKYWPNQEATILCYQEPDCPIESNCEVVSLGTQPEGGNWTDGLIDFFQTQASERFIIALDDLLLMAPMDTEKMAFLEKAMFELGASKAIIHRCMNKRAYPAKDYPGILRIHHNADYRLTLHPAIWTRDYFNHYLRPGYNAWEFETVLGREARMDNNLIIAPDIPTSLWD
jgi:hypothetical protein